MIFKSEKKIHRIDITYSLRDKFAYFTGVMLNALKHLVRESGNEILHFVQDDMCKYTQRIMSLCIVLEFLSLALDS